MLKFVVVFICSFCSFQLIASPKAPRIEYQSELSNVGFNDETVLYTDELDNFALFFAIDLDGNKKTISDYEGNTKFDIEELVNYISGVYRGNFRDEFVELTQKSFNLDQPSGPFLRAFSAMLQDFTEWNRSKACKFR